ncbi:E3 ubiquitin-protein ligase parkin-like isoform X2 [Dermacentor silvarum]|uniref:E3 ubiquitin-protein ligase parkin-like isoform X2 n=1 Tax=Dermacentor silvarum TaxID=543639 RepID=UPI002101905C|nr:E3 ubiquitin-protein ligase parkin-like isoform X2 [Dermacentor silvarum]
MAVFALHAFLDAFASFLWRRLAFLSFLRRKPLSTTQMNEITINVRFSADLVIPLSLARDATVQNLKERLAERLSLPVEEICVIFAGQELVDQVSIKDYNVEEQTTVHAVRSANGEAYMSAEVCCPLGEGIVTSQLTEEEHLARKTEVDKALFFVYCKQPCDRVLPGKLRVCCATCGEGSFILQKDPSCWQDVLEPGRLSGQCQICHEVRAARFFFKCTGTVGSHDDQVPIVLQLIRYNYLRVPCLACLDISQLVLVFKCAHVICLDCFRAYCHSRLDERGFVQHPTLGWTLPCPVGCADSLIEESHHFYLLGSEQYQRYQRFAAEEWVLQAGGVLCPRPGCGQGLLPEPGCDRVKCDRGCGFVFCRQCLQGHHLGPCSSSRESGEEPAESAGRRSFGTAAQGSSWDEASRLTVQATTKPCPKCRTPTERSDLLSRSLAASSTSWIRHSSSS